MIQPPTSIQQLADRAGKLAGKTIAQIAAQFDDNIPSTLKRKKGWQGQLIEKYLGADSGNLSQPDFSLIDVELKTLPINLQGKVQESTYVCVVNINNNLGEQWSDSVVFHKLRHVLWVPIAKQGTDSLADSLVGTPFFWEMSKQQEAIIRSDWENAMELISMGRIHQLNAGMGEILQVRPKAAHSRVVTDSIDEQGNSAQTLPRGFYLRPQFTQALLHQNLIVL